MNCNCRGGPNCCMCKPRYVVVEVRLPQSGDGWGVLDSKQRQVVFTGTDHAESESRAENLNAWEDSNPASGYQPAYGTGGYLPGATSNQDTKPHE